MNDTISVRNSRKSCKRDNVLEKFQANIAFPLNTNRSKYVLTLDNLKVGTYKFRSSFDPEESIKSIHSLSLSFHHNSKIGKSFEIESCKEDTIKSFNTCSTNSYPSIVISSKRKSQILFCII
ncbi:hypothetical protein BLOT_004910 [Blomia tropicalis]|nr:hypothetical protein BLOT_004910 [Blomia tropicalis]